MKITYELDLGNFKAWSGAVDTLNRIINADKVTEAENLLDDAYPEGMTETELNDLLWFESDWLFESLGIRTEKQIQEEIDEKQEELDSLLEDFEEETEDLTEDEKQEYYAENYKEDIENLKEEIKELEEEQEELA